MNAERRALWLSAAGALIVAVVGMVVAGLAESQAVLLDGMFNAVYVVVALVTLKVSRLVQRPDDRRFPFGYAYFEPLINAVKGLLMLATICLWHACMAIPFPTSAIPAAPVHRPC